MRNPLTLALLVVSVGALWATAAAQPEPPAVSPVLRVEPGRAVGPFRLDMALHTLVDRIGRAGAERRVVDLGEATRTCTVQAQGRVVRWTWRAQGLWLTADAEDLSVRVLAAFGTSGPFVTDRGVRLGDPLERAQARYGAPDVVVLCSLPRGVTAQILRYRQLGVQFTGLAGAVPQQGRVLEIGIFRPGLF